MGRGMYKCVYVSVHTHIRVCVCARLHHLLDDLFQVLVVGVVARGSQDGAVVHLWRKHQY